MTGAELGQSLKKIQSHYYALVPVTTTGVTTGSAAQVPALEVEESGNVAKPSRAKPVFCLAFCLLSRRLELPRAVSSCVELPRAVSSCVELCRAPSSCLELCRAPSSSLELVRAAARAGRLVSPGRAEPRARSRTTREDAVPENSPVSRLDFEPNLV